jgi:hypothetical protein
MLRQTPPQIPIATAAEKNNEERRFDAATPNRIPVYPGQRPLFLQLYRKEQDMAKRYTGIDLAKRTREVCILEGKKIGRHGLKTDAKGQRMLIRLPGKDDVVGYEVSSMS